MSRNRSNITIVFIEKEDGRVDFQNVETNIHDGVLTVWIYNDPCLGDFIRHIPLHTIDYIDEKRVPHELKVDENQLSIACNNICESIKKNNTNNIKG